MDNEPGRNDPCPCGSGKKYKKCCMLKSGAKIIPFPGTAFPPHSFDDLPFRQEDLDRYEKFVESRNPEDGPLPTFMQFMGAGNSATDMLNDLTAVAQNHSFSSDEELKAFMQSQVEKQNSRGIDDFLGLSPAQMQTVMYESFADCKALVEFAPQVDDELLKAVPQMRWAQWLLQKIISEEKGWKATQKGNLPRALVHEFYHEFHSDDPLYPRFKPSGESDLYTIAVTKFILKELGLIKFRNGRYTATQKAIKIYPIDDLYSFYKELFLFRAEKGSWLFHTRLDAEDAFIQDTLVFNLYLIAKKAADYISEDALSDIYLKAFPHMNNDKRYGFYGFKVAFIYRFCIEMGLLEEKDEGEKRFVLGHVNSYRTTELFKRLFFWHV